jgi:biotin-dependent carboxylase-like uncharacterized protein
VTGHREGGGALTVLRAGPLTTVQDAGRAGYAHLGVPRSGALDRPAYALATLLAGNPPGAAALETTLGGVAVRAERATVAAVTGAACPVGVDGRPAAWGAPVAVPAGSVLSVGAATHGVRAYVAFRGGIAVDEVLGSRSTDLLSGLGPAPLADGAVLPLGPPPPGRAPVALDVPRLPALPSGGLTLRVRLGPRHDWFTPAALRVLDAAEFRVSASSNRVGMRTEGPALERARDGELASEGMVLGAIQVPPDGRPVVFLADHPTTGGYPVIGVVDRADLPGAAQAPPGTPVRFTLTGPRGVGAAP